MFKLLVLSSSLLLFAAQPAAPKATVPATEAPAYTSDGSLMPPTHYREWIYLTSGIDMSYSSTANPDHSMFDNVFVNPASYRSFLTTGTWPDKTTLVLEIRGAESPVSINKRGHTQSGEIMGMELHVKDHGKWSFYDLSGDAKAGKLIPPPASCYTCHEAHAAVDTTFVQFYPTLLPLAKQKNTLSPAYLKEIAEPTVPAKTASTAPTYPTK
jgi:Cytochrome P460